MQLWPVSISSHRGGKLDLKRFISHQSRAFSALYGIQRGVLQVCGAKSSKPSIYADFSTCESLHIVELSEVTEAL